MQRTAVHVVFFIVVYGLAIHITTYEMHGQQSFAFVRFNIDFVRTCGGAGLDLFYYVWTSFIIAFLFATGQTIPKFRSLVTSGSRFVCFIMSLVHDSYDH